MVTPLQNTYGTKEVGGKVFPDGSYGWRTFRRSVKCNLAHVYIPQETYERQAILSVYGLSALSSLLPEGAGGPTEAVSQMPADSGEGCGALGLSEAVNYRKPPKRPRGANGITSLNRKTVRSVGTLLEFRYGKDKLGFATLTMPGLAPSDRAICQEQWSDAIRRFFEEMRRFVERKGGKWAYVSCTEIHPARSEREGWNAPHLHFVFYSKQGKSWIITPSQLRQLWKRIWQGRFSSSYSWDSCENLVRVKRSVAGYLSKYLSKGCQSKSQKQQGDSWHPSAWISLSANMKSWLKRACVSVTSIFPILSDTEHLSKVFSRHGQKTVKATLSSGVEIAVGVSGWISSREWLEFLGAFFPEKLQFD